MILTAQSSAALYFCSSSVNVCDPASFWQTLSTYRSRRCDSSVLNCKTTARPRGQSSSAMFAPCSSPLTLVRLTLSEQSVSLLHTAERRSDVLQISWPWNERAGNDVRLFISLCQRSNEMFPFGEKCGVCPSSRVALKQPVKALRREPHRQVTMSYLHQHTKQRQHLSGRDESCMTPTVSLEENMHSSDGKKRKTTRYLQRVDRTDSDSCCVQVLTLWHSGGLFKGRRPPMFEAAGSLLSSKSPVHTVRSHGRGGPQRQRQLRNVWIIPSSFKINFRLTDHGRNDPSPARWQATLRFTHSRHIADVAARSHSAQTHRFSWTASCFLCGCLWWCLVRVAASDTPWQL